MSNSNRSNIGFTKPKARAKQKLRIDDLCLLLPISFAKETLWTYDYLLDQSQYYNQMTPGEKLQLQVRAFETLVEIVELYNDYLSKNGVQYGLRQKSKREIKLERENQELREAIKKLRRQAAREARKRAQIVAPSEEGQV